jgi:hypothetical protein
VRINVASLPNKSDGRALVDEANVLVQQAARDREKATAAVERAI